MLSDRKNHNTEKSPRNNPYFFPGVNELPDLWRLALVALPDEALLARIGSSAGATTIQFGWRAMIAGLLHERTLVALIELAG